MGDFLNFWACYALCMANAVVAWLNVRAWREGGDARDFAAAIAWVGSAAYWLLRVAVGS